MTRLPDPDRSRAVLIGAGRYLFPDSLPEIPAVAANLADLGTALAGASTGTLAPEHCRTLAEPGSTDDIGAVITEAAAEATDLLLVYYVGHGLVDERGRLHLALPSTNPARLRWTAVPVEMLREEIAGSPAPIRVLVLDCCFSGRAIDAMADTRGTMAGQVDIAGTYTLTSTTANALSHAPAGATHTAFTGAMLAAVRGTGPLTLDELFRRADHDLAVRGMPRPQRRMVNAAGDLTLFRYPAADAPLTGEERRQESPNPVATDDATADPDSRTGTENRPAARTRRNRAVRPAPATDDEPRRTPRATIRQATTESAGTAGAVPFQATWTGQESVPHYTTTWLEQNLQEKSWRTWAGLSLCALVVGILGFLSSRIDPPLGNTVVVLVVGNAIMTFFGILFARQAYVAYRAKHFLRKRTNWSLRVGPDHIATTDATGNREFRWETIEKADIQEVRCRGPYQFTVLCLRMKQGAALEEHEVPSGLPRPPDFTLQGHAISGVPNPVCVLDPLDGDKKGELVQALAAFGKHR